MVSLPAALRIAGKIANILQARKNRPKASLSMPSARFVQMQVRNWSSVIYEAGMTLPVK
jgi:hypothetical protein